jgi:hypothetical protein
MRPCFGVRVARDAPRAGEAAKMVGLNWPKTAVVVNNQLFKLCIFCIAAAQHYCFPSR